MGRPDFDPEVVVMGMNEAELSQWFLALTPMGQILAIIGLIFLTIGIFALVIKIIEGLTWFLAEVFKLTITTIIAVYYTLAFIFIIGPIKLIFKDYRMNQLFDEYGEKIKALTYTLYPKLNKKAASETEETTATQKIVVKVPAPVQTYSAPQQPSAAPVKFHCNNCGKGFTPKMGQLLKSKHQAFCESCGQPFVFANNLPQPVEM